MILVTTNVVMTRSCWGIGFASVRGRKIVNNTVLDDGADTGTKNPAGRIMCRPGIGVGPKTHDGSSSNNVMVAITSPAALAFITSIAK